MFVLQRKEDFEAVDLEDYPPHLCPNGIVTIRVIRFACIGVVCCVDALCKDSTTRRFKSQIYKTFLSVLDLTFVLKQRCMSKQFTIQFLYCTVPGDYRVYC